MKFALTITLLVVCLAVAATVTRAQLQTANFEEVSYYYSPTCQQSQYPQQNYSTGVCQYSTVWYCDENGGYEVQYSGQSCTGSITQITKYDLGCFATTGSQSQQYSCLNPELGPSPPFAWPPAGFIVTIVCKEGNNPVCALTGGASVTCSHIALPANQCLQKQYANEGGSQMTFCTEDSKWLGVATYASNNCTELPLRVELSSTQCNSTLPAIQCSGKPLPVSQYPSAGVFNSVTSKTCQPGAGSSITYQQESECYDYLALDCANGTTSNEITILRGNDFMCSQGYQPYNYTEPTNKCLAEDSNTVSYQYFCNGYKN